MNILLTGGAGYIGSHTAVELCNAGYNVFIADNFSNSHRGVLIRLQELTQQKINCFEVDISNTTLIQDILIKNNISAVFHFAAYKSISDSISNPIKYYKNNVGGLLSLLAAMRDSACRRLIYSSSATVYGVVNDSGLGESSHILNPYKISEECNKGYTNPYAHTKLIGEEILGGIRSANSKWEIGILRYFNPVGAHSSGLIGEFSNDYPCNLIPYVAQVAIGKQKKVKIFGGDYDTHDGTGIRDYIHVEDLASGHLASLKHLLNYGSHTVNLGTGAGSSVLDVINTYETISNKKIPYEVVARRPGDLDVACADPSLAEKLLGWKATKNLSDICSSSWKWQSMNPNGYLP